MINAGSAFRVALALLCLGAVLLGATVIWKLSDRVYQIRTAEQSDPLWIASKLQFELLNFNAELAEYAIGSRSAEEVSTRFDILWSRLGVMQEGKIAAIINEASVDQTALVEFERVLEKIDPLIQSLPRLKTFGTERQTAAKAILAEIDPYNLKFKQLSLSMAQERSRILSEFRTGLLSLSNAIAYLGLVIVILASIVVIILITDLRLTKRKSKELQALVRAVEASSKMKDNFMIVVSHELRTPLTSIIGGISLFKAKFSEGLDEGANKLVNIAHRNSERLLGLVNDILDAQSLSEGKIELKKETMDLNAVISATVEECEVYASELSVKYSFANPDTEMLVDADEARISQVISNLLSNAAKFSHAGGVVDISARQAGPWIRVEVTDHGTGMLQADQANLFSRFHQINPGTTTARKSSGLGLSITKNLVEMHGGKVGVVSVKDQGSTFWFTLPALEVNGSENSSLQDQD